MPGNHNDIEKRLWGAADELRANSKLKASEYSLPMLSLIFLKYADFKFRQAEQDLKGKGSERRPIGKLHYQAQGVCFESIVDIVDVIILLFDDINIG